MCTTSDEYNMPDMKADMISFQMMYVVPVCVGVPKTFLKYGPFSGLAAQLVGVHTISRGHTQGKGSQLEYRKIMAS